MAWILCVCLNWDICLSSTAFRWLEYHATRINCWKQIKVLVYFWDVDWPNSTVYSQNYRVVWTYVLYPALTQCLILIVLYVSLYVSPILKWAITHYVTFSFLMHVYRKSIYNWCNFVSCKRMHVCFDRCLSWYWSKSTLSFILTHFLGLEIFLVPYASVQHLLMDASLFTCDYTLLLHRAISLENRRFSESYKGIQFDLLKEMNPWNISYFSLSQYILKDTYWPSLWMDCGRNIKYDSCGSAWSFSLQACYPWMQMRFIFFFPTCEGWYGEQSCQLQCPWNRTFIATTIGCIEGHWNTQLHQCCCRCIICCRTGCWNWHCSN